MEFAIKEGTFFWSTGYAWGTLSQEPAAEEIQVRLRVLSGDLWLSKLILGSECEHKIIDFGEDFVIREGNIVERIV